MDDLTIMVRRYADLDYETVVVPDVCGETPCFLARHPELPGCLSQGESAEEAVANLRDARELYIRSLLEDGMDVPLPHRGAIGVGSSAGSGIAR